MKLSKFVLMEHNAKKAGLHYDLRFELSHDKWDSFAIPKGIPENTEKKLIIRTSIHSEHDALFTGEVSKGYGSGKIKKIDSGKCEIFKYNLNNHIVIKFYGDKLNGIYHMINISKINKNNNKQYLFFKGKMK